MPEERRPDRPARAGRPAPTRRRDVCLWERSVSAGVSASTRRPTATAQRMQSAQFELHAEIEDRHWWFVARRQDSSPNRRSSRTGRCRSAGARRWLRHGCQSGGAVGSLPMCRHRYVGSGDRTGRSRFPGIEFRHGFAPADVERRAGPGQPGAVDRRVGARAGRLFAFFFAAGGHPAQAPGFW